MSPKTQSKVNRQAAIDTGKLTYESTTQCKKCGSYEKYVSSYGCVPCNVEKGLSKLRDPEVMKPYRTKEKKQQWLDGHREAIKEIKKRYKDANKDKTKEYYENNKDVWRDGQCRRMYGISLKDYNVILEEQDGKCAICRTSQCSSGRSFAVDHDHKTSKIRGLLCGKCNRGLGFFSDNVETMKKAIFYLEKARC